MKVGVCIPDKGDRPLFLDRCKIMLSRQTMQPDVVKIVDKVPSPIAGIDIAYRYYVGFIELFRAGCDVVLAMENDDYYHPLYIETMIEAWGKAGRPHLFGIEESIYYNIVSRRFEVFSHKGRASMMSTMVTKEAVERHRFNFADQYLDYRMWRSGRIRKKATFLPKKFIAIGIKHGFGLVGGAGHNGDWTRYTHDDLNFKQLQRMAGQDAAFYRIMAAKDNYEITSRSNSEKPFLTILTRCHGDRRPKGLARNKASVDSLKGEWQQIFIKDKKGMGLHYANCSFMLANDRIQGDYVFLLDDDNGIVNAEMITELQQIAIEYNPDVIVFRMTIRNGAFNNHYPSPVCWNAKKPMLANIGGSCMVVKRDIHKQFIHHFGHARFGDWKYLEELYKTKLNWYWHDSLMADTFEAPGHGKTEI